MHKPFLDISPVFRPIIFFGTYLAEMQVEFSNRVEIYVQTKKKHTVVIDEGWFTEAELSTELKWKATLNQDLVFHTKFLVPTIILKNLPISLPTKESHWGCCEEVQGRSITEQARVLWEPLDQNFNTIAPLGVMNMMAKRSSMSPSERGGPENKRKSGARRKQLPKRRLEHLRSKLRGIGINITYKNNGIYTCLYYFGFIVQLPVILSRLSRLTGRCRLRTKSLVLWKTQSNVHPNRRNRISKMPLPRASTTRWAVVTCSEYIQQLLAF